MKVIKNKLMKNGPAHDANPPFPKLIAVLSGHSSCAGWPCVCEGKTSIVHWVSFLTRELRWHCVTGISLEIRKTSIFQNQFNFVSSGNLLILPEAWFSQLELGDAISYLLGLSSDLQEDICKVHGIVIGTHQNSSNCRLNQTCSLVVHMSLDLK